MNFSGLYQFIWNNVFDLFGTAAWIYLKQLISFGYLGHLGYPKVIIAFVKICISPLGGYLHPNSYKPLHIVYSREVLRRYHHYTIVTAHCSAYIASSTPHESQDSGNILGSHSNNMLSSRGVVCLDELKLSILDSPTCLS